METKVYNKEGKEVSTITLPQEVFGLPWNGDLVHQVIVSMKTAARSPLAHTKDRGEVRGGGKKPWKQKGTGRARHGSTRSPIWRGGGITFGPRNEKNYDRKVNKKMKIKALNTILSQKMRDGEVIFVESLALAEPKTKVAKEILSAIAKGCGQEMIVNKKRNAAYIATGDTQVAARKSFANFGNVHFDEIRNVNPVDIAQYKYVIIENPKKSLEVLQARVK